MFLVIQTLRTSHEIIFLNGSSDTLGILLGKSVECLSLDYMDDIWLAAWRHISRMYRQNLNLRKGIGCRHLIPALNAGAARENTPPHAKLPPGFLGMDAWMTSRLMVTLIRKLRGLLMCLFFDKLFIHWCLYNRAMADIWSTAAGIKCLHNTYSLP